MITYSIHPSNNFQYKHPNFYISKLLDYYPLSIWNTIDEAIKLQRFDILTHISINAGISHMSFSQFILEYSIFIDNPDYLQIAILVDNNIKNILYDYLYYDLPAYVGPNFIKALISMNCIYRRNKILKHIEKYSIDFNFTSKIIYDNWWINFIFKQKWNRKPFSNIYKVEFRKYPNIKQLVYTRLINN